MITKIQTKESERLAIVFDDYVEIEDIIEHSNNLIELMLEATYSETFENSADCLTSTLLLLKNMMLTNKQISDYNIILEIVNSKNLKDN